MSKNPSINTEQIVNIYPRSMEECIKLIRNLPDDLIEYKGMILDWEENNEFNKSVNLIRSQYRALADWLKYYLLGYYELFFELSNTSKAYFKSLAERSKAIYDLASETYLLSDILQKESLYPVLVLYLIEREICITLLNNSGITDKPNPIGKGISYETTKNMCERFENATLQHFNGQKSIHSIQELLVYQAKEISLITENYEFRSHYHDFLKSVTRCEDKIRRNKNIQVAYLDKNSLSVLNGRGKRKKVKCNNLDF